MTSFKALRGTGTATPATPAPYQVIAVIGFESLEAFQAASKESGKTVMGDIANFTDVTPVVQINEDLD